MKKRALTILSIVLLLLGAGIVLTSCRVPGAKTFTVGVRSEVADWGLYSAENDYYLGIEVDLAKALAERLECSDLRFVPVNPSTRLEKLQAERWTA